MEFEFNVVGVQFGMFDVFKLSHEPPEVVHAEASSKLPRYLFSTRGTVSG